MTLRDVFLRWFLMRGVITGALFFCIEHFIFIPQISVVRVALSALLLPGVFLALGLAEYAKRDRSDPRRSHPVQLEHL